MILELNTENIKKLELGKLRFTKEEITNLLSRTENHTINDVYFDYKNQKIYTGIDMARNFLNQNKDYKPFPFSYPDLIPEYYNIKLAIYLKNKQRLLGIIYNEVEQTKEFINEQLREIKSIINDNQTYLDKIPPRSHNYRRKAIIIHKAYVFYLEKIFKEPQQIEANKSKEVKKELKDFFKSDVNLNFIKKIQEKYSNSKGKKIAFLIFLLEKEFKLIEYSLNSKDSSRKHFIQLLAEKQVRTSGIDKYFESNSLELDTYQYEKDNDFIDIKKFITNSIN
jgi:hypothetical protein